MGCTRARAWCGLHGFRFNTRLSCGKKSAKFIFIAHIKYWFSSKAWPSPLSHQCSLLFCRNRSLRSCLLRTIFIDQIESSLDQYRNSFFFRTFWYLVLSCNLIQENGFFVVVAWNWFSLNRIISDSKTKFSLEYSEYGFYFRYSVQDV